VGGSLLHESDELGLLFVRERAEADVELGFGVLAPPPAFLNAVGQLNDPVAVGHSPLLSLYGSATGPRDTTGVSRVSGSLRTSAWSCVIVRT
jgi:hypothetical protein